MRALPLLVFVLVVVPSSSRWSSQGSAVGTPVTNAPARTTPAGTFFAVSVQDLGRTVDWYSKVFDLRPTMSNKTPQGTEVTVLEGTGLVVELVRLPEAVSLATALPTLKAREYVHGIFKTGVIVTDFDGLLARLRAGGVEIAYGPFPARDTQRANLIVRDPEGNLIQFFGSAPGGR